MLIDSNTIFSMTQANLNFSQIARVVNREGKAVIFKHNKPKYLVVSIDCLGKEEQTELKKIYDKLNER